MSAPRLLVDIGNSRVKWALARSGELEPGAAFPSECRGLWAALDRYWSNLPVPAAVEVSNVAGAAVGRVLGDWLDRRWRLQPRFASVPTAAGGIRNGYTRPEQLGVDRWLALQGLCSLVGLPACVADCGTALTFDAVDAEGRHLGGAIAPGIARMREALLRGAPSLAMAVSGTRGRFPAHDTATGISAGISLAAAGFIEKCMRACREALGDQVALVLTGGDGPAVGEWLELPYRYDAHLVLRGMLRLAENDA